MNTYIQLIPLLILLFIIAIYALAIWRVARMRGVIRIILAFLLAVPPALIIWREMGSHEAKCLAYESFDGNQVAVLSEYANFFEGHNVHLAYRDTTHTDLSLYYLDHQSFLEWRAVRIVPEANKIVVFRGKERMAEFDIAELNMKSGHRHSEGFGFGNTTEGYERALDKFSSSKRSRK